MSELARFAGLLGYDAWATAGCHQSLASVPSARRGEAAYAKALGICGHVQLAREVWLSRLTGKPTPPPTDWFPSLPLESLRARADALDTAWRAFLGSLKEGSLAKACRYTSSEGKAFESLVGDILTHVINHGTYHRGQVALLVTSLGGERATTDYIAKTRSRV